MCEAGKEGAEAVTSHVSCNRQMGLQDIHTCLETVFAGEPTKMAQARSCGAQLPG